MRITHKAKRPLTPLPQVAELITKLHDTPNEELHEVLSQMDAWRWPRSDLNAWIKVLNKFDAILEEVIRDYDLDKLQINVFTPVTKKTVCEILRFERLLLENSTNRKTFNSYDRLNSLMLTSDLDVLILTLNLLLRPAQQYSSQPAVLHALSISTPRLTSLARRWSNLREYDINLVDLVTEKGKPQVEALPTEAREVNFTFYKNEKLPLPTYKDKGQSSEVQMTDVVPQTPTRKGGASSGAGSTAQGSSSGAVIVHIESSTIESKEPMDILADAMEMYSVPDDEKFELLTRIRTARALTPAYSSDREKLVMIRLLATAIFGHTHVESQAQSMLFLYEPDMITHIAELLQLDRDVDVQVQNVAIAALDSLGRYRNKIQDVLTAVNAGVNHGVLMALLRKTVVDVAQPTSTLPQFFVESLLSFVTFVATHASGGNMVVGAGLVPLLIQVIENRLPNRLYVVSKTMQLLDNVLYGFNNAFQLFCNGRGVEVLVDRIEYEVELDLAQCSTEEPSREVVISFGKLLVPRAAVLKHTLRSMHRMMQSSGTAEGLRGLLDSSLLRSAKKIMENRTVFGPSILPIVINIMATFVHNEPTCLSVIQEAGLPEVFYGVVESGVEPVIEVIQSIPNAIGALCLNQAGQDQLTARPYIIPGLLSIFTSERHQRILQDKENAVLIGTAIEELIRHHPSLKQAVFNAIKAIMDNIYQMGNDYVPDEDMKQWYLLLLNSPSQSAKEATMDADVDMASAETAQSQRSAPTNSQGGSINDAASLPGDDSSGSHDNIIVSFIDVFGKFLEGFFQCIPHCRDFVTDEEALSRFGKLTALPCLPYDFVNSLASDSLVQVVRTMAEVAPGETVSFLVRLVHESLASTKNFWSSMREESELLQLVNVSDRELQRGNDRVRQYITLYIRTSLLSDIYSTAGYSHGRATATLLQSLTGPSAHNILPDLGALHRTCVWENIMLKSGLALQGVDVPAPADVTALDPHSSSTVTPTDTPPISQDTSAHTLPSTANGAQGESSVPVASDSVTVKDNSAKLQNAKIAKHLASQLPTCLAPFFQGKADLLLGRNTDSAQKQKIQETSLILADILVKHLDLHTVADKMSVYAYHTVMLGLSTILLVDERAAQKTLYTVLLAAFSRAGGIDAILRLCNTFVHAIKTMTDVSPEDRSHVAKEELVHAYGGLKVALHLLHPVLSAKPLFDSTQTTLLVSSEKKDSDPDYFEPRQFLVRTRIAAMPLLADLWGASWLSSAPLGVSKSVVNVLMDVLSMDGEEAKDPPQGGAPSLMSNGFAIARPAGPDENRIRQLVDMGFPRSAAERALVRTRNNVNAATELLLAHPFPLPPDPEPQEPPVAADAPIETSGEVTAGAGTEAEVPASSVADEQASSVPVKSTEDWIKELNALRDPLKDTMGRQALRLLDEHPSLAFDVQKVFVGPSNGYREQAALLLIDDVKSLSSSAYDVQEQSMAVRCRLLALALNDPTSPLTQMIDSDANNLMDSMLALLLSNPTNIEGHPTVPKWLAAHLLVAEALLTLGEEPRSISVPKENEAIVQESLSVGRDHSEAKNILFDFCLRLLALSTISKDDLLSALRLFVYLTRDHKMAEKFVHRDGLVLLFRYMQISAGTQSAAGIQSHIAIILRHIVEDQSILQHVMRQEIKRFFAHPRHRVLDVGNYVTGCGALALRDPSTFINVTQELCQLSQPYSNSKSISLRAEVKSEAPVTNKGSDMHIDDPFTTHTQTLPDLEAPVHFLIAELMRSLKRGGAPETSSAEMPKMAGSEAGVLDGPSEPSANALKPETIEPSSLLEDDYVYSCFLMQCLSELLFSYDACKIAFLSFSPKRRTQIPAKDVGMKHRTAAIQFLLMELVTFGTIDPQPSSEARKRIMLCNWAMSVVVALCVDTSLTHDIKDVPAELISVRKFVLEAISRALKDLPASEPPELRYSRLLALADLCNRLLTVRFNSNTRKPHEEAPTHIAKVMLEKNFVATLTNALAEVDLNYPNIRGVVTGLLRPLNFLSKIAIKMSRVSDKSKESLDEKVEDVESVSSEEDDTTEHDGDETPDLYRNSSLGLFGGEMEDVNFGPDDDMDEDGEEADEDVDMDFGDETGSEDTSHTDDDVEDDIENAIENETDEDDDDDEESWQDEEEEEEEGLVANDGGDPEEIGDEEEEEEGEGDDGEDVMWQSIAVADDLVDGAADEGDDDEDPVPIMPMDADEEADMASEEDEYGDELGVAGHGPIGGNVFELATAGFANVLNGGAVNATRIAPPILWADPTRSGRRRGIDDDMDIFSRIRNAPISSDAATHPLLVDPATNSTRGSTGQARSTRRFQRNVIATNNPHDLLQTIEDAIGEGALQLFQHIVSHQRGGGGETIRIDVPSGTLGPLQRHGRGTISASIRLERAPRSGDTRSDSHNLDPLLTVQRWLEEVKMVHGKFEQARLSKLSNHVNVVLMPAAVEAAKQAKLVEEEAARQAEEQAQVDQAAAKEQEEAERARVEQERLQLDSEVAQGPDVDPEQQGSMSVDGDTDMVDVSQDAPIEPDESQDTQDTTQDDSAVVAEDGPAAEASSSGAQRITVMIHGSPVDITETGIDPTFLEALPDDMREEVLNQHVRDQRAARVERPADSHISPEFLDALPPELRAEILQQESIERARQQVTTAQQGGGGVPADIDPASFIASLDPHLRQVVLMDSDDGLIQSLPSHILAEAGIHRENARQARAQPLANAEVRPATTQHSQKTAVSRDAIQLLDKSAVAVLVRLLFFPHTLKKNLLYKVLVNLCENSKTRTDLFNLLLNILQDGSGDLASIDRSFAQMSVRNSKQPHTLTPKSVGKQRVASDYLGTLALSPGHNEIIPELIVQRCLEALTYIVSANELSSLFFLTEHELPLGLRRTASKKGKGKEKQVPQTHYPVVLLLSLLDRPSILRTSSIVESVVTLLATITRPLASLKDFNKGKPETQDLMEASAPSAAQSVVVPSESIDTSAPAEEPAADDQTVEAGQGPSSEEKVLLARPPVIPHTVMRFIVNILTAGECSGRTFSQSLALIQHLSFVPDARDIIANELRSRAQDFGQSLFTALDELAIALHESQGEVLASSIASKFSPASSDQAKLLRVLKTIDYMYSPRSTSSPSSAVSDADVEKVQGIYESFRFAPLWQRLGDCLSFIEEKPETEHIATVLLPLIESLMVVCKYVGAKSAAGSVARILRASASPRSPTSTRETMEELFVTFTDAHRKVLNLMVRNNPSLMSGSFSLLVHNPRVLDFDNKRNYFSQQLHRRPHAREHHGTLQLNVRRPRVFEDSFQYLQRKTGDQIKYGKLSVRFYEEEGVDAGGVTREWFQILARQMFDPNYALFQPCAADRLTYQPNKASWVNPEHLSFFKFVGRVIGKAIYDGRLLDAYFARSLYRQILAKPVDYRDVEWVDPEYYNSLCWILDNDPSALELTFSVEADEFGVTKIVDLRENGRSVAVTQENKREFVQLSAQYRLYSSIKDQIEALLTGFYEIIPKDLIAIFNEQELELLISGTPDIDVDEWRAATEYNGYTSSDPVIVWWWRALKSFNREERAKVLSFATGTSRVPLGGFTELQGVQGVQRFSIHRAYGDQDRLPQAHTCFNQIDLPQYSSYEMLRQQLLLAINEGGEGFGFA
ncbi:uncharacterized protein FIBRA_03206 [Fibroporia radiculosa]|uniref:HECT-type E3 ubiquitin transferase n=1 Tax=Fibroporia radiculosa TaxID=599839 RepID=J4G4J8_9APHY|nr:uncharacterized protein FIBRA_03206 [Fibroporia radiculosa]CCM01158.1 predicted protein [Fibroporia radiculosa]